MICLFSLIFIMPILIKFPTRCPKGLDRSVYSHLVCSIMALQVKRGGPEGWPEWREQQRSALRQPTFMLGYSRACVVICRVIGISFYPLFRFLFSISKKNKWINQSCARAFSFWSIVKVIQNDSKINRTRLCARMWYIFNLILFNYRDILYPMMIDRCVHRL